MRLRTGSRARMVRGVAVAVALVAVCAVLMSAKVKAQDDGGGAWRIVRALYGWRDQQVDVTDLVRDWVARGGLNGRLAVNNQTLGGDPAVGQDKALRITARSAQNEEREFTYREGASVDVGMFAVARREVIDDRPRGEVRRDERVDERRRGDIRDDDRGDERQGVWVLRAYWGVQGRTVNVTDLLRSTLREGGLRMVANNRTLGGDPAPGADKMLIVVYRVHGQETAVAVREGETVTIP